MMKRELKNKKTVTIREPNVNDAQNLIDYLKTVDSETRFLAREPGEFGFTVEQEAAFIERLSKDKSSQMLLADIDGEIVGNCSVGIVMDKQRYLHRAALGIAVKQEYWGQGIGRILMDACISWCRQHNVEQLELEVVTENERALGLYKRLGFETYGTKKHALKYGDGTYADEYFMILFL